MRLSTGISEIGLAQYRNNKITSLKVYTWPLYNSGKVEKAEIVQKRPGNNFVYIKASQKEKDRLLSTYSNLQNEYNSKGTLHPKGIIPNGLLFEAVV